MENVEAERQERKSVMYKIMYVSDDGLVQESICRPLETFKEAIADCDHLNHDKIGNDEMFYYPVWEEPKKRLVDYPADIVGTAVKNMKLEGLSLEEIVEVLKGEVEEHERV